jgi:hypothetical protein
MGGARGELVLGRIEKRLFLGVKFGVETSGVLNGSTLSVTTTSWETCDFSDSRIIEGLIIEKP